MEKSFQMDVLQVMNAAASANGYTICQGVRGSAPLGDKKEALLLQCFFFIRVDDRTRTDNIQNHNLGL